MTLASGADAPSASAPVTNALHTREIVQCSAAAGRACGARQLQQLRRSVHAIHLRALELVQIAELRALLPRLIERWFQCQVLLQPRRRTHCTNTDVSCTAR